jgi:hemoglobin
MRNYKMIVLAGILLAMFSLAAVAQTKSLYERLGGKESIIAVVDDLAARCLADTRINAKFAKSDPVRLKTQLVDQICNATGGPCQYTGRNMGVTHLNMGVTTGEFNALVEDLVATLDKFNVPATEKDELLKLLAPMKSQIVEVESNATGTALPKKYKPWNASAKGSGKNKANKSKKAKDAAEPAAAAAPAEEKMKGKGKKSKKSGEAEATAPQEPAAEMQTDKKSKKKSKGN